MNKFIELIENAESIAIFGHIRPDGDCVGSSLGLYNYICEQYDGKKVSVFLEEIPSKFNFLKGADKILHEKTDDVYDLGISLDCSDTDRHGIFMDIFAHSKKKACIDHHRSNLGFGDYYYCDPDASSTSEIVCRFIDMNKISKEVAECLYLGIIHDTGVLKYPCTSEATMQYAGKLISLGARSQYIIDETFYKVSYKQNLLTGRALLDSKLYLDGKVIESVITREIFEQFDAGKEETEGIIDKLRVTDGVEVAIFSYQLDDDTFKFSLRSIEKIDVSSIAVAFGGGGHYRASGFEAKGDYQKNLEKVLEMIKQQF